MSRKEYEQKFCPICNKPLSHSQLSHKRVCCSKDCGYKHRTIVCDYLNDINCQKKFCLICNKQLTKEQINNNNLYCCRKCYHDSITLNYNHWTMNITPKIHEILEGLFLGDGNLEIVSKYPRFKLSQGTGHKDYCDFFCKLFCFPLDKVKFCPKEKDGKIHDSWYIDTGSGPIWESYYNRWYPNNIKTIPDDFVITKTSLLHHYLSDGHITHYDKKYKNHIYQSYRIVLSVMRYSYSDIINKIQKPLNNLGFDFIPSMLNRITTGKNMILVLNKKNQIPEFLRYLGINPIPCYNYKFEHPNLINDCIYI